MAGDRLNAQPRPGAVVGIAGPDCSLVIRNDHSELARVADWVRRYAHECGLTREAANGLDLAVTEALTNVISYAYQDGARHDIVIQLQAEASQIRARIEDDGVPFNPLELAVEAQPLTLDEARPTGRGIPLIRSYMSELHYSRNGDRNVLTMMLNRTRS